MTTNMLAISNMLAGTIGAGPSHAEPLAIKKRNQSSSTSIEDKPLTKARKNETVDNTHVKHKNRINDEPTNEFSHTFRKEITSEVSQKAKNSRNTIKQNLIPNAAGQPSVIQPLIAQWFLRTGNGPEGIVNKVELKSEPEHAQLFNNLSKDKSLLRAGKTAKPQNSEPIPIVNSKQIGLKEIPPKTSQIPLSTEIPSSKNENANRMQMPEGRPLPTRSPDNEQNGEGLALQPLIRAHHGITTANKKPEEVPVSNTFGSQQITFLSGEGLKPQVLVNAVGEMISFIKKPIIAGKSVVPVGRKVPLSNPNIPLVQGKPSGLQPQPVGIGLRKSPLTAEEGVENRTHPAQQGQILPEASTDDKATAVQSRRSGTPQFTEPLADDMTEQGQNSSGNMAYQHLRRAQLQVSAGPIKGRNSSVSNNSAESGFEQILSGNNAAAYVEEQTSAFSEVVKTDNLPTQVLLSDVSASITEQILESIQSSSSQQAGTQQITIRLNPPELGKVLIKFEEQENKIIGLLEVSKAQTRYEVEQALPQIIQNLSDSGIQIKRLEVMLTDQNGQQSYGDESLQDGLLQQHHDLPGESNPDSPGTLSTNHLGIVGNNSSYQDGLGPQMQITDNSINILI